MLGRFYVGQRNTEREREREEEESTGENEENLSARSARSVQSSETLVAFPRVVLGLDPRLCLSSESRKKKKKERGRERIDDSPLS